MMPYEAPELATIGEMQEIVRGPGSNNCECGGRYLFEEDELLDILDEN